MAVQIDSHRRNASGGKVFRNPAPAPAPMAETVDENDSGHLMAPGELVVGVGVAEPMGTAYKTAAANLATGPLAPKDGAGSVSS
ncbi:hypothetical protein [Streptomyces sp. NPDC059761]|uniref:hypothetical protein n=1 Tax=Streptomyces sp. NPDC059761 TaxID=3346937 RepID=UPI00365012FD